MSGPLIRGSSVRGAGARTLTLVLVVILLLAGLWSGGAAVAATADEPGGLEVDLTLVSPAFLRPGVPLTVAGTVTNHTASDVTGTTLTLRLQRNAPRTRSAIDFWLDLDVTFATLVLARQPLAPPLAPGGSTSFRLTVLPEDFPIPAVSSAFGTRGIAVDVEGTGESGTLTGTARTLLVWFPGTDAQATTVSVVVPLVPTASELIGAALGGTTVAEQSAGRIVGLAQATAAAPAVAWALDPLLLAAFDPAPSTPEPTPGPSGPTAEGTPQPDGTPGQAPPGAPVGAGTPSPTASESTTPSASPSSPTAAPSASPTPGPTSDATPADLGETLQSLAAGGREVIALAYADADAAAATHARQAALFDEAVQVGEEIALTGGISTTDEIAWPAATSPDLATLATLARSGASSVVLPEAALPLERALTYTPTGRGTVEVSGPNGTVALAALLTEPVLSAALAGSAPAPGRDAQSAAARALDARQYVLAVTAMISRERPAEGRHVLAVLPRTFAGDDAALADRIAALAAAPWATLAPPSALAGTPDPGFARSSLPGTQVEDAEVPAEILEQVRTAREELAAFALIAEDPALLVRQERRHLLQVTSAAFRADTTGRVAFLNAAEAAAAALPQRVGVLSGGTVNLISDTGDLPVTVRNALDQPITAQLRLTPDGPSLQLPDVVTVEVPAGSEVAFPVRVHAVGSADVEVLAELTDAAGQPLGTSATLVVRVRADWENVGTAILAAIVGLVFIVGLVRSIRRARRRGDSVQSPEGARS